METLVVKFGGASVAEPNSFGGLAQLILKCREQCHRVVVVVSAMQGMTDQLIALAEEIHPHPPQREYDMLLSVGERISMSLLAMALALKGQQASSLTGSQAGIITCGRHSEARIIDVRPRRVLSLLDAGKIVIVAGFQGVSREGEITTLGRGGSDTTAVALALAIGAKSVVFYKDVKGVFSCDPKLEPTAMLHKTLTYSQALCIANGGAKVLHPRAIALAERNGLPLFVRSFKEDAFDACEGTHIADSQAALSDQLFFEEEEVGLYAL